MDAVQDGRNTARFDPHLDPGTAGERWRVWLRNFKYYIDGQTGLTDGQKIARLMFQAGPDVQEIYETVQNTEESGDSEFDKVVKRLNKYFVPKANVAYERQEFRSMKMHDSETVEQFSLRLRKQIKYCSFDGSLDDRIRDELIEKCCHIQLKRKYLKKGGDLTLSQALEMARLYEQEQRDCNSVKQCDDQVARISKDTKCFRCGYTGHYAKDSSCPALKETCDRCGAKGHFKSQCKTKKNNKNRYMKTGKEERRMEKRRHVRYVVERKYTSDSDSSSDGSDIDNDDSESESAVNSIFNITSDMDHKCELTLNDNFSYKFLIDSGASINIVNEACYLELCKAGFKGKLYPCNDKFYGYGGELIPNLGYIVVDICCKSSGKAVKAKVLIYNGKGKGLSLLGRDTAIALDLLRVGPSQPIKSFVNILTKESVMTEYPNLFKGIGKLKDFELKIPINTDIPLVAQPVRRQPFGIRDIERRLICELLDNDIIERVTGPTPCVSPSHIVKKKEAGQYRLVVDMRKANEAVLRERVPLPTFEELLQDLNGCTIFSKVDIKMGYHQLQLEEASRYITTFSSSEGLFRYKRLVLGIRCASEMFQRIISQLLQGIDGVANSQDDIRIGGRTQEEHDHRLQQVLCRLQDKGITLNEKKCVFGVSEIEFLGHYISADGIRPTSTNQQVVQEFRAPQSKEEVRSFLGLVNFSARFIPNFSTISAPLRQLTKKDVQYSWTDEHQQAFQDLKDKIASAPVLGFYDKDAQTTLVTDASPVGIAAVLIQHQVVDNKKQPIIIKYASKALSKTEQKYSQTEKEALAIVWACENLYMYLIGKEFIIISDHKPLEVIYSPASKPSARIQRWVLRLQPYTFKVIYKPGKTNIADPLSRLLDTSKIQDDNEDETLLALIESSVEAVTLEEIAECTQNDDELCKVRMAIQSDIWPKELRRYELIKEELCSVSNVILRRSRVLIPKALTSRILGIAHEGHISVNGMKAKLRTKVWWKTMDKDIEYWIDTCEGCRLVRQHIPTEPIVSTDLPSKVWELVAVDYLGPLPSGDYLLLIIDYYSRYYEVETTKHPTCENTIKALTNIMAREGMMDTLLCDNGPAFRDERFKKFLKTNGIKLRHTTPLWPQANGEVERQNRSILRRLRIAQALKLNWKQDLLVYLLAYRTTPHSTTGVAPGELFRGRPIKTKIPELGYDIIFQDEEIRDRDRYKKRVSKEYADAHRHARTSDIQPGDTVLVKQRKENKLSTPFSPEKHTVVWKTGNSVAAESPQGKIIRRNSSHFQKVNERDMTRFSEGRNIEEEDKEETLCEPRQEGNNTGSCIQETQDLTQDLTANSNSDLILTKSADRTNMPNRVNRPRRERCVPPKYKDYVLGLILDCMATF